jgi:hypothetical protein
MVYRVKKITELSPAESDNFDAGVEAEWGAGPAESGYTP